MSSISLRIQSIVNQIREDILNSSTIYILSSFIMLSGVNVIFDELQVALNKGADIKILSGDYLLLSLKL